MPDKTEQEIAAIGATGCAVAWADRLVTVKPPSGRVSFGLLIAGQSTLSELLAPLLNGLTAAHATQLHDHRHASLAAVRLLQRLQDGAPVSDRDIEGCLALLERARAHDTPVTPRVMPALVTDFAAQ